MRFLRQSLAGLFLLSVTVALLAWAGQTIFGAVQERMAQEPRVPQARERVFAVNVVMAEPGQVTPVLRSFGEVESRRTLDVRAAASGRIVALAPEFQEGGAVEAGSLLARIDPADAQTAVDRARSDLSDAEAEARDADRAFDLARNELAAAEEQVSLRERAFARQSDLSQRGVGSAAAVETAELNLSTARQQVLARRQSLAQAETRIDQAGTRIARARLALDEAQRRLVDTEVRAAFSGVLTDVAVVEGGLVGTNERLAGLVDPTRLEVALRLSTAQYARLLDDNGALRPLPVTVTLDVFGLGLESSGSISRASAAVGEGQTGRVIFVQLDDVRGLKPGDFVTVEIEEPPLERVIRLPASALGGDGNVLVLGDEDRLEAVPVTLLRRQGDDILIRARGLGGREVVAERTPLLGAGIKVRPLRPGAAEAEPEAPEMVELSEERRAKLVAFVEGNNRMPAEAKARVLSQLKQPKVPAQMVARIEGRMGG